MKQTYNNFTQEAKDEIRSLLQAYVARYEGSTQRASDSLSHVSNTSIRSILTGRYENISDAFWRNLRGQIGTPEANDWVIVDTPVVKDITFCLRETQEDCDFVWAISPPGSGKTETAKKYVRENSNAFYIQCDEAMAKSDFAIELARAVGLRVNTQRKARIVIMEVIQELAGREDSLLIFDEADKLSDSILYFFITIYNHLKDKAGVVFLSTDYMKERMKRGLRLGVKGFPELWSRIASTWYDVDSNEPYHVDAIIRANGVSDSRTVAKLVDETIKAGLNLRRTCRKVRKEKKKAATQSA